MIDGQKHSTRKTVFARFARSEDGGMIALGLIFFTLMVMMGGLAVDLMRYEAVRTQLQQTSDRAALAAASLRQKRTPASVVEDYFAKAGLSEYLQSVTPLVTLNAKSVDIVARAEVHPFFMPMLGIDEMTAPANSGAMERITDVEISLVLDISGSMDNNNRMENIRTAASDFVADRHQQQRGEPHDHLDHPLFGPCEPWRGSRLEVQHHLDPYATPTAWTCPRRPSRRSTSRGPRRWSRPATSTPIPAPAR